MKFQAKVLKHETGQCREKLSFKISYIFLLMSTDISQNSCAEMHFQ